MKKWSCIALALFMFLAFSLNLWAMNVSYVPVEADRDFMTEVRYVARDAKTKKIIPLSVCTYSGMYALCEPDAKLEPYLAPKASFNDYGTEFFTLPGEFLAARGVMNGDGNGNFLPNKKITRAEASAILFRLLGADEDGDAIFADVAKDAWYAPAVNTLCRLGIISEAEYFYPDAHVTRAQMHTMFYRMLKHLKAGVETEGEISDIYKDSGDIPSYALPVYKALIADGYMLMADYEYEYQNPNDVADPWADPDRPDEITYGYFKSNQAVERQEAAEFLYRNIERALQKFYPARPTEAALAAGLGEEMPVIDGSTSSYPLTESIYTSLFYNSKNHPQRPQSHSKTITSYERLIKGEVDLILVPDPNSDIIKLMEDTKTELTFIPVANEALIFFTGKNNPASNLTRDNIKEIYINNSISSWKDLGGGDAPLAAFCRNNDSGSHAQMEKFFLGDKQIHEDIKRERTSIMMASILSDVELYERMHPQSFALGYSMYFYFAQAGTVIGTENLKLLAVDGTLPSKETIGDGSYPLTTNYYAVIRASEEDDSPARRLAAWLCTKEGQDCIEAAGFGSLGESVK